MRGSRRFAPGPEEARGEYLVTRETRPFARAGRLRVLIAFVLALMLIESGLPLTVRAAGPVPFGKLECVEANGVRECIGGPGWIEDNRVRTWDGVPLDADVFLPAEGNGPWPLLVMLPPWGFTKTLFEADRPNGGGLGFAGSLYNTNFFARQGYAVLTYTGRGVVDSCGSIIGSALFGNGLGRLRCPGDSWLHFADLRYEIRDTQYLAGILVDEGIAEPDIAVTGESYGAGQSTLLATLEDRMMLKDGSLIPWTSPQGVPMSVGAALPIAMWSDFVNAAMPNGRGTVDRVPALTTASVPIGVLKNSWIQTLYLSGTVVGQYANQDQDVGAALPDWLADFDEGEPYDPEQVDPIFESLERFHSAFYTPLPADNTPAPTMIQQGWDDDLFPPRQAINWYNRVKAANPDAPVRLRFAGIGHPRATNKLSVRNATTADGIAFLNHYMLDDGDLGPPVRAWTVTCPKTAGAGGPFDADSWETLNGGNLTYESNDTQNVTAVGGRSEVSWAIDPEPIIGDVHAPWPGPDVIAGLFTTLEGLVSTLAPTPWEGADACREVDPDTGPIAEYDIPETDAAFTVLGIPTIEADITVSNGKPDGEMAARLWDYDTSTGKMILVTRGIYRLDGNQSGTITWQLNGNGWRVEDGHRLRLEITGRDDNTFRPSNNDDFEVEIGLLKLTVPTLEPNPGETTSGDTTPDPANTDQSAGGST